MKMFFVAGIGLAVFIEFLLVSKKNKSLADRVLTVWMFVVAIQLLLFFLYFTGDIYHAPFLLGLERPLPMLHAVMLFFYVSVLTGQGPSDTRRLLFHLAPTGLIYLWLIQFYLLPAEQKITVYQHHGEGYELFNLILRLTLWLSGVTYVIWSLILLRRHRDAVQDQFSNLAAVNLRWLQVLTYGVGAIWLLFIVFQNDMVVFSGVVLFIFVIGFFGVRQGEIFTHRSHEAAEVESANVRHVVVTEPRQEQREKYQKSGLSEEASSALHASLIRVMTEEALYKNSDLSIDQLATKLNVHPNYLSQVINQREQKHFFDFVNGYRVDEFRRRVASGDHEQFTLLALAYDSGFSSKTSFNRCFKKTTGQTPTEYIAGLSINQGATLQNGTT
jgi:AraC-like DNA-binding protein